MATFTEVKDHNRQNIRKILEMAIFVKPWSSSSTPVTAIWDDTGLLLPSGFVGVGLTTKEDGATWPREQENSETESYGYAQPTRRDVVRDVSGLGFTMQESKRQAMEIYHGVDMSAVTTDTDGNFFWDRPARPVQRLWEVLALGKDGDGPDAIYVARFLPEAQVSEQQEQSWNEGEEVRYPASFTGYVHEGWGTSFREVWGGPGVDHEAMGFPAPA